MRLRRGKSIRKKATSRRSAVRWKGTRYSPVLKVKGQSDLERGVERKLAGIRKKKR